MGPAAGARRAMSPSRAGRARRKRASGAGAARKQRCRIPWRDDPTSAQSVHASAPSCNSLAEPSAFGRRRLNGIGRVRFRLSCRTAPPAIPSPPRAHAPSRRDDAQAADAEAAILKVADEARIFPLAILLLAKAKQIGGVDGDQQASAVRPEPGRSAPRGPLDRHRPSRRERAAVVLSATTSFGAMRSSSREIHQRQTSISPTSARSCKRRLPRCSNLNASPHW